MKREKALTETSSGLPVNALFPVLQRHDEVYQGHLISIHHQGIIVVSASLHIEVNLSQLCALGTILPQPFSASLQGREYLSMIPIKTSSVFNTDSSGAHARQDCAMKLGLQYQRA